MAASSTKPNLNEEICNISSLEEAGSLLNDILRWRALDQPDRRAYTFLSDGETDERHITFAELDRKARAISADLQARISPGSRALLLYPPGLDYIAAFYGCLYANVVAVPLYSPKPSRPQQRGMRPGAGIEGAQPSPIFTPSPIGGPSV